MRFFLDYSSSQSRSWLHQWVVIALSLLVLPVVPVHLVAPAGAQAAETQSTQADRLLRLGGEQFETGQFKAALASWQQALKLYQQLRDTPGQRRCLINLGAVFHSTGDYRQAIDYYQQSLALSWQPQERQEQGQVLNNLGLAYRDIRDYKQATTYLQQSLAIAKELNNQRSLGQTLGNLGLIQADLQDYPKAIDYHQQALKIFRQIGAPQSEALTLSHLGDAALAVGDFDQALGYHQQSLKLAEEFRDPRAASNALASLGQIYTSVGDYRKALAVYQQSLAIAQQVGDRQTEGNALKYLGNVHFALRDYGQSAKFYQQSLSVLEAVEDAIGIAEVLQGLGNLYYIAGDYPKAITFYQPSLDLARQIQDRAGELSSLGNLGNAYQSLQQYAKAIDSYRQALTIARQDQDRLSEWIGLNNLGAVLLEAKDLPAAELALRDGIRVSESLRQRLGSRDAEKISIFEQQTRTYQTLQKVLIAQNQPEAALEIAEQGRARAFIDLLSQRSQSNPAAPALTIDQLRQIAKTQNATLVEYSIMTENLKQYGNVLAQDAELFIWVVQPNGKVTFRRTDLKSLQTSIEALVTQSREALEVRTRTFRFNENQDAVARAIVALETRQGKIEPLKQLHQVLIQPIADLLPSDPQAEVIFVPQGALFLVPFPALQSASGEYLIQRHTLRTAPAMQVLEFTRQQQQKNQQSGSTTALVVGNPTMPQVPPGLGELPQPLPGLPGAEAEAKAIATLLKTEAITGDRATEAWVMEQMPQAKLIHLATHGLLDDVPGTEVPGAIALAPDRKNAKAGSTDGLLTTSEILNLKLKADLVVLSACDTGRGRITGDGVIGLSRALLTAGASSVVVSLWKVPDASTALLMTEFYQSLQQQPNKAQALRQAMLATLKVYPDPKDWAAFTLMGEAK